MDLETLAEGLPPDVRVIAGARGVLVVREDVAEAFLSAGYGPDDEPRPARSQSVGKRPLGLVRSGTRSLLVRRFHHGGLLRWLTGERFASPRRPFDEWRVASRLSERGMPTPAVVAARAVRAGVAGWRLDLATERVPDAIDLGVLLAQRRDGTLADPQWRRLLAATGRFLADLHRIGFEHADLTPRNLLAQVVGPRLWVIDLDGSRFVAGGLDERRRTANLERLQRHLLRMHSEHGARLSRCDRWRFLAAYAPERGLRRRLALRLGSGGAGAHRLGWLLERALGRGRGSAEAHLRRGRPR
jgi:tRNA A-37 threonylcarbamoyl transferase component Bud32